MHDVHVEKTEQLHEVLCMQKRLSHICIIIPRGHAAYANLRQKFHVMEMRYANMVSFLHGKIPSEPHVPPRAC